MCIQYMKINRITHFDDKHATTFASEKIINMESQEKSENGSRSNKIVSKFSVAQNDIKKKFEEALMNRLEHEGNAIRATNPTSNDSNATASIDTFGMINLHPNELCVRLKSLIDESIRKKNKNIHMTEIKSIVSKLYDLDILV